MILSRRAQGSIGAKGDNCAGPPDFSAAVATPSVPTPWATMSITETMPDASARGTSMDIVFDGDGAFADVPREKLGHTTEPMRLTALTGGMQSGKPSICIGVFLPNNGGCVIGETSLALFLSAADAFKARFGDPRE